MLANFHKRLLLLRRSLFFVVEKKCSDEPIFLETSPEENSERDSVERQGRFCNGNERTSAYNNTVDANLDIQEQMKDLFTNVSFLILCLHSCFLKFMQ